jgi:hypothetical protein
MSFPTPVLPPDRWRPRPIPPGARSTAEIFWRVVIGSVVALVGSLLGYLYLLGSGFRCDDWCHNGGTSWRTSPDSWQWAAMGWLGAGCMLCSIAFAISLKARRSWLSFALLAGAVASAAARWFL